jgi:hypothetical protein
MKVVIIYRPVSEHATSVESFVRDFKQRNPTIEVELLNADEREAIAKAEVYDLTSYPAILAMTNDGQLLKHWQGEQLPLMNEVASYGYSGH